MSEQDTNEQDTDEHLSAFVDGEIRGRARDRVVDILYRSPELRRRWARYHLIGDAIRKSGPVPGADSIAANVSAALASERIVRVTPRWRRWRLHPLPGLALAAAVAAVAVLGVNSLDDGGTQPEMVASVSPLDAVVAGSVSAGALRFGWMAARSSDSGTSPLQWGNLTPEAEARLNAYLVSHNEYAGHGMPGMLPYVRIVGQQSPAGDDR